MDSALDGLTIKHHIHNGKIMNELYYRDVRIRFKISNNVFESVSDFYDRDVVHYLHFYITKDKSLVDVVLSGDIINYIFNNNFGYFNSYILKSLRIHSLYDEIQLTSNEYIYNIESNGRVLSIRYVSRNYLLRNTPHIVFSYNGNEFDYEIYGKYSEVKIGDVFVKKSKSARIFSN